MRIVPVPCLTDNYAYLIFAGDARVAVVVDPSEAPPIEAALARDGATLGAILLTHHHFDHIGGAAELAAPRPALPVYAFVRRIVQPAIRSGSIRRSKSSCATFSAGKASRTWRARATICRSPPTWFESS